MVDKKIKLPENTCYIGSIYRMVKQMKLTLEKYNYNY